MTREGGRRGIIAVSKVHFTVFQDLNINPPVLFICVSSEKVPLRINQLVNLLHRIWHVVGAQYIFTNVKGFIEDLVNSVTVTDVSLAVQYISLGTRYCEYVDGSDQKQLRISARRSHLAHRWSSPRCWAPGASLQQ